MYIRGVFLDREGVLTPKLPGGEYVLREEQAVLVEGVIPALHQLIRKSGCWFFIVTNQSCIARGLIDLPSARRIQGILEYELADRGVSIKDSIICPHVAKDGCTCRKPKPGMILDLCERYNISPRESVMIGDSWTDMQAAEAANCAKRILIADKPDPRGPTVPTVPSLAEAVQWMIGERIV